MERQKAMVSVCDSINYLLEEDEIIWTLQSVNRYLEPGGFLFLTLILSINMKRF